MKTILFDLVIKEDKHNHPLIRVGDERDGGYLLPLGIIENSNFLISGGLNYNIRFELGILNINPSIELLLYDKSVSSFKSFIRIFYYLLHPKRSFYNALVDFGSFKILLKNKKSFFYKKFILKSKVKKIFKKNFLGKGILKLDIENSEWELLESIIESKQLFHVIIIEFHDIIKNKRLLNNFISELNFIKYYIDVNDNKIDLNDKKTHHPNVIELHFLNPDSTNLISDIYKRRSNHSRLAIKSF